MTSKPIITQSPSLLPIFIQSYERYLPTAFDESMSILQKMNKVINHLNDIGEISNNIVKQWNDLMKWIIDNGLGELVSKEIDKRIADGTFDALIYRIVGDLTLLETIDKTNMVSAINEVNKIAVDNNEEIGDISLLNTANKNNLVESINEMLVQVLINKNAPISIGESTGHGTISGLKVRQQSSLAMAVEIGNNTETNIVHLPNGVRYTPISIALPVKPSHNTLNRIDIIYVDNMGVISYLDGVQSLTPIAPVLPVGGVLLAEIKVNANDTTINDTDIIDKRELKSLSQLLTNNKSNLVQAINEIITSLNDVINNAVGDVANLPTNDKTNVVNAIIELFTDIENLSDDVGLLSSLTTVDKATIVNAINEVVKNIGKLSDLTTTDKGSIVKAINEVIENLKDVDDKLEDDIDNLGDKNLLNVQDKSSVVNAINEVIANVNKFSTDILVDVDVKLKDVKKEYNDGYINIDSLGAIGDYYLPDGSVNPTPTDNTQFFVQAFLKSSKVKLTKGAYYSKTFTLPINASLEGYGNIIVFDGDGINVGNYVWNSPTISNVTLIGHDTVNLKGRGIFSTDGYIVYPRMKNVVIAYFEYGMSFKSLNVNNSNLTWADFDEVRIQFCDYGIYMFGGWSNSVNFKNIRLHFINKIAFFIEEGNQLHNFVISKLSIESCSTDKLGFYSPFYLKNCSNGEMSIYDSYFEENGYARQPTPEEITNFKTKGTKLDGFFYDTKSWLWNGEVYSEDTNRVTMFDLHGSAEIRLDSCLSDLRLTVKNMYLSTNILGVMSFNNSPVSVNIDLVTLVNKGFSFPNTRTLFTNVTPINLVTVRMYNLTSQGGGSNFKYGDNSITFIGDLFGGIIGNESYAEISMTPTLTIPTGSKVPITFTTKTGNLATDLDTLDKSKIKIPLTGIYMFTTAFVFGETTEKTLSISLTSSSFKKIGLVVMGVSGEVNSLNGIMHLTKGETVQFEVKNHNDLGVNLIGTSGNINSVLIKKIG